MVRGILVSCADVLFDPQRGPSHRLGVMEITAMLQDSKQGQLP